MYLLLILTIIIVIEASYLVYKTSAVKGRKTPTGAVLVDTSALMDGRIVTAAQTGFLPSKLIIPTSVVAELQLLADQADAEKRSRARRGLDAIQELQTANHMDVTILEDGPVGEGGVDARLVELAVKYKGSLCTIDFNLNKVATVKGVRVLNINELAGSIRMAFLPGETISLPLNQKGQGNGQAVGHLADGTMVVVDKGASHIGQIVEVEFIRSLQTAAGRMMFAKLVESKSDKPVNSDTVTSPSASRRQPRSSTPSRRSKDSRAEHHSDESGESATVSTPKQESETQSHEHLKRQSSRTTSSQSDSKSVTKQTSPGSRRPQNRKRSKEDDLMELVNNQ